MSIAKTASTAVLIAKEMPQSHGPLPDITFTEERQKFE